MVMNQTIYYHYQSVGSFLAPRNAGLLYIYLSAMIDIEKIKEFLEQGIWKIFVWTIILLISVYTLIWTISEPINNIFPFTNCTYIILWIIVILVTLLVLCFIRPNKILYKYVFTKKKLEEQNWETKNGQPIREIMKDWIFGEILFNKGSHEDVSDCTINDYTKKSSSITYIYSSGKDFHFYLYVDVISKNQHSRRSVWLCLKSEIEQAKEYSEDEWELPIKASPIGNGRLKVRINLKKAIAETYGIVWRKYSSLHKFRIRWTGKIQSIILR